MTKLFILLQASYNHSLSLSSVGHTFLPIVEVIFEITIMNTLEVLYSFRETLENFLECIVHIVRLVKEERIGQ